jgi:circadian clock protein KaiC
VRSEFARLLAWLKDKGVTSIVTGEHGVHTLTKHGLEEYISDCVLVLDQRVEQSLVTRRLRIVKYRGSSHGTNEYPFLIDQHGISVLPVTSVELEHAASDERVSTGIEGLDEMLGGKGYFQGSSILVSGTAGTGKTSLAAHLVDAACRRGEKCVYFAFEESKSQLARNMRSIVNRSGAMGEKGLVVLPCDPADDVWTGDASGENAPTGAGDAAAGGRCGPDIEFDIGGNPARCEGRAAADGRPSEAERNYRFYDGSDRRRA